MTRVLVVDDDEAFRTGLVKILKRLDCTVTEAADGRHVHEQLRAEPVDVVMTDIIMPEKEGLETILTIRRQFPNIRIIAMSGGGRVDALDYLKMAKTVGAHATLQKPFDRNSLQATLQQVIPTPPPPA